MGVWVHLGGWVCLCGWYTVPCLSCVAAKCRPISQLAQVSKFVAHVEAIGTKTIQAVATSGPESQASHSPAAAPLCLGQGGLVSCVSPLLPLLLLCASRLRCWELSVCSPSCSRTGRAPSTYTSPPREPTCLLRSRAYRLVRLGEAKLYHSK